MEYKEEKKHTLSLDIDVGKGSRAQNKKFDVEVIYKFPPSADELVKSGGAYDILVKIDGEDVKIGAGGAVRNNGQITLTDKESLLKVVSELPGGNDVTQRKLDSAMANGGNDNLRRNGQTKRNDNLTPEQQNNLSSDAALTAAQSEANGLSATAGDETVQEEVKPEENSGDDDSAEGGFTPIPAQFKSKTQQFGTLYYPEELNLLKQDYIKYRSFRYKPQTFNGADEGFGFSSPSADQLGSPEGTCYLPISGGVSDGNSVSWGSNQVNPLQALAYEAAYGIIVGGNTSERDSKLSALLGKMDKELAGKGEAAKRFIATKMAESASQTTNMLSRTSGAVLNPNMVLLFQNAELRNFTFTYKLRPRNESEAISVRKIIRMFKQSMSVRRETTNLFLLAPNIFAIEYFSVNNETKKHKSIGQVKLVALKSCNVDYAADGSYMTFNDENSTMTAYNMSLSFTELEPVYYDDYEGISSDQIGF